MLKEPVEKWLLVSLGTYQLKNYYIDLVTSASSDQQLQTPWGCWSHQNQILLKSFYRCYGLQHKVSGNKTTMLMNFYSKTMLPLSKLSSTHWPQISNSVSGTRYFRITVYIAENHQILQPNAINIWMSFIPQICYCSSIKCHHHANIIQQTILWLQCTYFHKLNRRYLYSMNENNNKSIKMLLGIHTKTKFWWHFIYFYHFLSFMTYISIIYSVSEKTWISTTVTCSRIHDNGIQSWRV